MRLSFFLTGSVALAAASMASAAPSDPTFYKDVLPVLQKNCQTCHRPGEAAPMSFLTYDSTRPWAKAIKTAVATKKMPPWFADPHVGKFGNDPTLSAGTIETLVKWADAGAPAGNPSDAPAPLTWVEGWRIGKPDVIIKVPQAFSVPASGTVDYQYVIVPTGFTEDKYVSMAEARPSSPSVVHHILAFVREPGSSFMKGAPANSAFSEKGLRSEMEARMKKMQQEDPEGFKKMREAQQKGGGPDQGAGDFGDMIAGYAPGTLPNILKPGQVKLVPAGSDIIFQIHYTANGKPASDVSELGLVFANYKPVERVLTLAATTQDFVIPAGNPNYEVDSKIKLQDDATLINMLPHMHFRGKSFEYRVTYPSGEKETLLDVPNYDFNWQLSYDLSKPKVLPKGSVIECTAHYDNSADNKWNPDPTKDVRYGEQTWEEMMFGFFDVSVPLNKTAMDLMVPADKRPHHDSGF
jgi:hypothetical protein